MKPRITQLTVVPEGMPIFDELAITVTIDDEAGGEFVVVRGQTDTHHGSVAINPSEWPALRDAIDQMVKECK